MSETDTEEKKCTIRMPMELHERIRRSAKDDCRSINMQICVLLDRSLEGYIDEEEA